MSEPAQVVFRNMLMSALTDLMTEYGSPLQGEPRPVDPAPSAGVRVAGIIGFTEERFGGIVAVQTSPEVVAEIVPGEIRGRIDDRVVVDWMGELANQLLGRAKNKMLKYGASFQMSPPTTVTGSALSVTSPVSRTGVWLEADTPAGPIRIMIDFRCEQEVLLSESHSTDHVAAAEGDMMLF